MEACYLNMSHRIPNMLRGYAAHVRLQVTLACCILRSCDFQKSPTSYDITGTWQLVCKE